MTPRKLTLLYKEYKDEFGYRDRAYIGLHEYLGIKPKETNDNFDEEESDIDG